MQHTSYAPLIEFHGFSKAESLNVKEKISEALKKVLSEKDYDNLTFSEIPTEVVDVQGNQRPFIRMFSSEYAVVHKVIDLLKSLDWKGEIEFIKIANYFDLREKKE